MQYLYVSLPPAIRPSPVEKCIKISVLLLLIFPVPILSVHAVDMEVGQVLMSLHHVCAGSEELGLHVR